MKTIVILLITWLSHTTQERQCSTKCGSLYNLTVSTHQIDIERIDVPLNLIVLPPLFGVWVLRRHRYSIHYEKRFGSKPVYYFEGPIIPEEKEAQEWVSAKKCKIGTLCKPGGDCWGSGSNTCYEKDLKNWVKGRDFEYVGVFWEVKFRDLCTQDFSCSIEKKETTTYFDEEGAPYIKPGENKIYLDQHKDNYFKYESYGVWVPKLDEIKITTTNGSCVHYKETSYCDFIHNSKHNYVVIEEGDNHATIENIKVVTSGNQIKHYYKDNSYKAASINDLQAAEHLIRFNDAKVNYNFMNVQRNFLELSKVIKRMIISDARYNPQIISDITGLNVNSKNFKNELIEVCGCKGEEENWEKECKAQNKVNGPDKICHLEGASIKTLELIHLVSSLVSFSDPIHFRGEEKTIEEDEMERSQKRRQGLSPDKSGDGSSIWLPSSWFMGLWESIKSLLVYINSVGLIILFVQGRR